MKTLFLTPNGNLNTHALLNLAFLSVISIMMLIPEFAYADNPFSSESMDIPGTAAGDSWAKKFGGVIKLVIFLILLVAFGLGLGDSVFNLFDSIKNGRKTGEWGETFKTVGVILVAIILAVVLTQVAYQFVIEPIDKYFT